MVKGDSEHANGGCALWALCILNHKDNNCKKKQGGGAISIFDEFYMD